MTKWIFLFLFLHACQGFGIEKLDQKYEISYGSSQAPIQITEYFSFSCPSCVALFKKDFKTIYEKYVEMGQIRWVFHPIPLDALTVQAMECLSHLSNKQKIIFLEAILDTVNVQEDLNVTLVLMQEAMKCLNHPLPELDEEAYITKTQAFQDAVQFVIQPETINKVPCLEVNGTLFRTEIPTLEFIEETLRLSKDSQGKSIDFPHALKQKLALPLKEDKHEKISL